MTTAIQYAQEHHERFLSELFDLIRIPSISTMEAHTPDIRRAAEWLRDHLTALGMKRAEVMETDGHPIVYAEWLEAGDDKPTVLVYGHYDVQPAATSDGWTTENPFEPVIRDGNIVARGAADDKGQMFMHLKAFEALMQATGTFPVNIKMMFEGEEEDTSKNLPPFIEANRELLAADIALISDTGMQAPGIPTIPYGLRGIVLGEVTVYGPERDLHSGMYGGTVDNPIHVLSRIIASLHDEHGRVAVDGFYDDVRTMSPEERKSLASIPFGETEWKQETGASQPWGDPDYTIIERIGARPTLDMLMVRAGQVDGGVKAIVAHKATAHISCRIVPNQDPRKIFERLEAHIKAHTPPTARVEITMHSGSPAVLIDRDSDAMQKAVTAYEKTVGRGPLFTLVGGSIPVVTDFKETLGLPVVMMGFSLPDDNIHSPDEKYGIEQFSLGIKTLITYYELLAE